jgi:hypothetical protein
MMEWILLVIVAGSSQTGVAINSTNVPMANVERCNVARDKLLAAIKVYQSPTYVVIAECLQSR